MLRILVIVLITVFCAAGCSNVDVYTFKKDRVDQKLEGNEGYLAGDNSDEKVERNPKRTMIGIDIGLGETDREADVQTAPAVEAVSDNKNTTVKKNSTAKNTTVMEEPVMAADKEIYSDDENDTVIVEKNKTTIIQEDTGIETIVIDKDEIAAETEEDWIK